MGVLLFLVALSGKRLIDVQLAGKLVGMKIQEAGLFEAKTHLSEMVAKVEKVVFQMERSTMEFMDLLQEPS